MAVGGGWMLILIRCGPEINAALALIKLEVK